MNECLNRALCVGLTRGRSLWGSHWGCGTRASPSWHDAGKPRADQHLWLKLPLPWLDDINRLDHIF